MAVGGLLTGVMLQLSVPLRMNWFAIPPTGLREPSTVPHELSARVAAPPEQLRPTVESPLHESDGPTVHELHEPHEPAVKPVK